MITSLTNVGQDHTDENNSVLGAFDQGAAFSMVYNPITRQFLAFPSGDSRLSSGLEPPNLVARRGGHRIVNEEFSRLTGVGPSTNVGLTIFINASNISIEWRSGSVNGLNPSFPGDIVPKELRPQIVEVIREALNREVVSG